MTHRESESDRVRKRLAKDGFIRVKGRMIYTTDEKAIEDYLRNLGSEKLQNKRKYLDFTGIFD